MKLDNVQEAIKIYASNTHDVVIATDDSRFKPTSECLTNYCVLRISRKSKADNREHPNCKTLLIVQLENLTHYNNVIVWAAEVKQCLLDPETADLYLFIYPKTTFSSENECIAIESDDQICRKYVQLKSEAIEGLLNRSFLAAILQESQFLSINAPIETIFKTAFSDSVSKEQESQKKHWKRTFLNPFDNGSELLTKLLSKTENDYEA